MKTRIIALFFVFSILLFICAGCDAGATIPHSSDEYENGEWSVEELVEHFEDLGFTDIKIEEKTTFDESEVKIQVLVADDSDSWFPSYRDFEKGETISTMRKIIIRATSLIPVLTVDNNSDFAKLVNMDQASPEKPDLLSSFMQAHDGDYLEFNGTITNWSDEFFWTSVSLTVAVEDSNQMSFSWGAISLSELDMTGAYDYNNYYAGLIKEGMKVHIIAKIDYAKDGWALEINSMDVIE